MSQNKQPENAAPFSPLLGGRKPLDVTFEELGNEYQWHYAERNLPEPIDEQDDDA